MIDSIATFAEEVRNKYLEAEARCKLQGAFEGYRNNAESFKADVFQELIPMERHCYRK